MKLRWPWKKTIELMELPEERDRALLDRIDEAVIEARMVARQLQEISKQEAAHA